MVVITGDTHRNFQRVASFCARLQTTIADTMIILGDAGINYFGGAEDFTLKRKLSKLPITLFCVHGNHERRPESVKTYQEKEWHGGIVYVEPQFPNLLFAKDGEIYDIAGKRCIVIGGAYSVDKSYRLAMGWHWWPDEQPSLEIKSRVEQRLEAEDWKIDVVLSHTCPLKYEPTEVFLQGIDQSHVDKSTELWLDSIEGRLNYKAWYCGHYHTNKVIDRMRLMFEELVEFR